MKSILMKLVHARPIKNFKRTKLLVRFLREALIQQCQHHENDTL